MLVSVKADFYSYRHPIAALQLSLGERNPTEKNKL